MNKCKYEKLDGRYPNLKSKCIRLKLECNYPYQDNCLYFEEEKDEASKI